MKKLTATAAVCIFLLFSACHPGDDNIIEIRTSDEAAAETSAVSDAAPVKIAVYICGDVLEPGVYYLEEGSRIADAIEAAGGAGENADLQNINLAQRLADGQQIVVSSVAAGAGSESVPAEQNTGTGKINLNRATKEELMTLPGIGEAKAESIIKYREEVGWISSTDEIMNISGIKDKVYEKISDLIEV